MTLFQSSHLTVEQIQTPDRRSTFLEFSGEDDWGHVWGPEDAERLASVLVRWAKTERERAKLVGTPLRIEDEPDL